jgi:hypothetical protein
MIGMLNGALGGATGFAGIVLTIWCTLRGGHHPSSEPCSSRSGFATTDAARALAAGQIGTAAASLFRRSVAQSLWALIEETPKMRHLARRRKRTEANDAALYGGWRSNQGTEA